MSKEKMAEILTDYRAREDMARGVANFWSRLWRNLLTSLNMTPERFNELAAIYREPGMTRKQENDARRRLLEKLASPTMSFLDFVRGLRLLRASSLTIKIEVEFNDAPSVAIAQRIEMKNLTPNP